MREHAEDRKDEKKKRTIDDTHERMKISGLENAVSLKSHPCVQMFSEWCVDSLMLRNIKSVIVGWAETDLNFHTKSRPLRRVHPEPLRV